MKNCRAMVLGNGLSYDKPPEFEIIFEPNKHSSVLGFIFLNDKSFPQSG
jgi:hypothetical protein